MIAAIALQANSVMLWSVIYLSHILVMMTMMFWCGTVERADVVSFRVGVLVRISISCIIEKRNLGNYTCDVL
jgi:hypothetical protein